MLSANVVRPWELRSPWWRGGGVAQVLPIWAVPHCPHGSILFLLLYNLHFYHQNCIHCDFYCWFTLYKRLLHVCLSWERDHCCSWGCFLREFFLIQLAGLRTKGVICYTDCKAPWGKLWFVIFGYINKTGLTWLGVCRFGHRLMSAQIVWCFALRSWIKPSIEPEALTQLAPVCTSDLNLDLNSGNTLRQLLYHRTLQSPNTACCVRATLIQDTFQTCEAEMCLSPQVLEFWSFKIASLSHAPCK